MLNPYLIATYPQPITMRDYDLHREKKQTVTSKYRPPGVHVSGIIRVLSRRGGGQFSPEDNMPHRMTQGLAIEAFYFGLPFHSNTLWQLGPQVHDGIVGSPDGLTPTICPVVTRLLEKYGPNWRTKFQPWILEEFKSTYYSFSKAATPILLEKNFKSWLWQMACYLYLLGKTRPNTVPKRDYVTRLTGWWVNGDYSMNKSAKSSIEAPHCQVWVHGWNYDQVENFWKTRVVPAAAVAKQEVH